VKKTETNSVCSNGLLHFIGTGAENAVPRRALMSLTGLDDRELRRTIEGLRRAGRVICSSAGGYFQPASLAELSDFRRREENRARSIFFTLRAARTLEKRMAAEAQAE